jgi:hypothetical protein
MNWLRNAFRLFLSLATAAVAFVVLLVIWAWIGDGKMASFCIVVIGWRTAFGAWDTLGYLFPGMFGESEDGKEEEE